MTTSNPRPIVWDPKSPATLFLPSITNAEANECLCMDTFLSHDGVGCNAHERSALVQLMETHSEQWGEPRKLSREYRRALRDCAMGWEQEDQNDDANLELLLLMYAVTQLSEVFLLTSSSTNNEYYQDTRDMPGAVTADTVRYLRLHHMADPYADDGVVEMLESNHPEQFHGSIYWKLMKTLVLRGCLDDVWALLSRHSLCRRFLQTDAYHNLDDHDAADLEEDRQGFLTMRALLLSAPLPGGRNDGNDAGLDENLEEDENDNDRKRTLMEGIPRDAYQLWESTPTDASSDSPIMYNPQAAISIHKTWRRAVHEHGSLTSLVRRIPQLQSSILAILTGDFLSIAFESWSEALCAELLYQRPDLKPQDFHIRTARVMEKFGALEGFDEVIISVMKGNAARAIEVLHALGGGSGAALPATITCLLCNLLTDAGQIPRSDPLSFSIQTELLLAASQAILSSLSLTEPDLGVRLSTKLLLPYATPDGDVRITATLAETLERHAPQTDAEARTLLGLCRPLVARKSIRVLDGCVSLTLSRHRDYISEQKFGSAVHWLLKGLELEVLGLATTGKQQRESRAWPIVLSSGTCGRLLCMICTNTSHSLLVGLLGDRSTVTVGRDYVRSTEMVAAIRESDMSDFANEISEVKLLLHVHGMALAIVEEQGDAAIAKHIVACLEETPDGEGVIMPLAHLSMHWDLLLLAHMILMRDQEREEQDDLTEKYHSSFDVRGIQRLLERFTQITLIRDGETIQSVPKNASPARSMTRTPRGSGKGPSMMNEISPMRLALGKGLMRAIVAENSKRNDRSIITSQVEPRLYSALSSKLSSYSRPEQERVVEMMLDLSV